MHPNRSTLYEMILQGLRAQCKHEHCLQAQS